MKKWEETGKILEKLRREKLKGMIYNWEDVDALLQLGDDAPERDPYECGLIEMQSWFMKGHPKK